MESSRRQFVGGLAGAAIVATSARSTPGRKPSASRDLTRRRFGLNYVPSKEWYFIFNNWDRGSIDRDFDAIAELGADHVRVMVLWPAFQPNPTFVSPAHLDRFDALVESAGARGMDVQPTLYTGWLSGFRFDPPFYQDKPFYRDPDWRKAQIMLMNALAERLKGRANVIGYDLGNEMNVVWKTTTDEGDAWMRDALARLRKLQPNGVHVNGVDNSPWFENTTFSPQALVAEQPIVALHCWPFWTGAADFGGPLDTPYTHLPAGMAALARSYARDPAKPIWIQEFGACSEEMPERDVPRWLDKAMSRAIEEGVSWFTWWGSHDIGRRFDFHPFEYSLGLLTQDNKLKPQGRLFRDFANAYRNTPVKFPAAALPAPPRMRTKAETWRWLLAWMGHGTAGKPGPQG